VLRTTLTLDEDVAAKLTSEARRSGRSFREVVNEALRRGLSSRRTASRAAAFRVIARDLGALRPGLTLDRVSDLLEQGRRAASPLIPVDANLLLHAYDPRAERHRASRSWLEATFSGPEFVRLAA
jgi:hypothetical protein